MSLQQFFEAQSSPARPAGSKAPKPVDWATPLGRYLRENVFRTYDPIKEAARYGEAQTAPPRRSPASRQRPPTAGGAKPKGGDWNAPEMLNAWPEGVPKPGTPSTVAPPAPQLPPPATQPAVAVPEANSSAAEQILAKATPAGTPIAPGAMDLANAGDQLEKLGLGRLRAGQGSGPAFSTDWKTSFALPPSAGAKMASSGYAVAPGAFADAPPIDPEAFKRAANSGYKLTGADGESLAKSAGGFDGRAAFGGGSTDEELSARRRAALLDPNVDSLEGTRRARLVVADEIAARGGDLQKYAADSGQMRAMSMKQLEGYLGQIKAGKGTEASASATPGAGVVSSQPIAPRGFDPLQDAWEDNQDEELGYMNDGLRFGGADDAPAPGMTRRDIVTSSTPTKTNIEWRDVPEASAASMDRYLRDELGPKIRANPANGNGEVLKYQTFQQNLLNPDAGAPDPNRLSARAAAGLPAEIGARESMYAAQNALVSGTGTPKPGATVPLPQLNDEQLARLRSGLGPAQLVTPPSGYGFYNIS